MIICRKLEECLVSELEKLEPYDVMKEPICSQCLTLIPSQQQVSPRVFVRDLEQDEVYPVMGSVYSMKSSAILRLVIIIYIAHFCKNCYFSAVKTIVKLSKCFVIVRIEIKK